nr:hypothetical protein [Tanacetum cinerariifolium]
MTDQLDWDNPEGQQYPHNLLQPLPLIPDNRGHRVISFAHFINNDPSIFGEFYGFAVNRESALDIYSKRRIIAVTDLKIVEWHNSKHLDWISVRRDDDKIYKFKEGDFKRLRLQDIEDMLLLLVQGKLSNLTVEERFAFNKRLNLTKPDTYRSDLKRQEACTAYSYPRGFIYQNKDKKNRLMRIDELHKFSDRTLNDVRNALDDRLKGIRMQTMATTIKQQVVLDKALVPSAQRYDILFSTIKVVSRHQNTQQYGAILPIELTTEDIRNTKAYKEYYACATGEAAPKPKASARKRRGGSDSSTTPPTHTPTPITTIVAAPRLTVAAKGKQPARATSPTDPSDVERTEAE